MAGTGGRMTRRVKITSNGKTVEGYIIFASQNQRSLVLFVDDILDVGHGVFIGPVPVFQGDDGQYRELRGNTILTIERVQ
jgi:hypothetical protein